MCNVVILGAGIGGQVIAKTLSEKHPSLEVFLVGTKDNRTTGLFYLNEKIEGVTDKEINITYDKIGNGTIEDYEEKSRGCSIGKDATSSFNKVGSSEKGYLISSDLSGSYTNIKRNAIEVDLYSKEVVLQDKIIIKYDYLISTIPLKAFMTLIHVTPPFEFKSSPVYVTETSKSKEDYDSIKVVYDTDPKSVYYRYNHYYNGNKLIKTTAESLKDNGIHTNVHYGGKIVPDEVISSYVEGLEFENPEIKLCGRFARWEYHYLISDSYKDSMKFIESRLNLN